MARFVVDISDVTADIRNFPPGVYEATVENAKPDVSQTGNPLIRMDLRVYSPKHGEAILKDNLPAAFPAKVKAFWMAYNDWTEEDIADVKEVEIDDVSELNGAQILIQLGDQENKTNGKTYRTVVSPFYYPISRLDLLDLENENSPI